MKAGWENWQGGFIRVGYPPPCQPPLTAIGSSSLRTHPERFVLRSLMCLERRTFFPTAWVLFAVPPKWSYSQGWRSVSTLFRRIGWRGFRPCRPFPISFPKVCPWFGFDFCRSVSMFSFPKVASRGSVFDVPFVAAEVGPKTCYRCSSRLNAQSLVHP